MPRPKTLHETVLVPLSRVQLFVIPWTLALQAPLSLEFSRQEYWGGLPFPSPGDLPNQGIKPWSPALQADSSPLEPPGNPCRTELDCCEHVDPKCPLCRCEVWPGFFSGKPCRPLFLLGVNGRAPGVTLLHPRICLLLRLQSHPVRTCTYVLQHAGAGLLWGLSEVDSHTRCSVSIAGSLVPSACGPLLGAVLGITNPAAALPLVRGAEVLGAAFPGATCLV